jgi:polyhydroxybutyrate depolymerase
MIGILATLALQATLPAKEDCFSVEGRPTCVVVPSASSERSVPLVIYLHGYGASGREDFFHLASRAEADGFLYAFPDGIADEQGRRSWSSTDFCCARTGPGGDDVAFLDRLIDEMEKRHRVDAQRIFMAGHSLGGFLAQQFACDGVHQLAAIVSHAGAPRKDPSRCRPSSPPSVLLIHGDADRVVSYEGGSGWRTGSVYPSAQETFQRWARLARCRPPRKMLSPVTFTTPAAGKETLRERYEGCANGTAVELWTMQGIGHMHVFNEAGIRAVWDFLVAHPGR